MNATTLSAKLSRPEPQGSLENRILQAELRLIAREENLRRGISALGSRLRHAAQQPRRWAAPVLGGMAALGTVWWFMRGRRGHGNNAYPAMSAGGRSYSGTTARQSPGKPGNQVPWVRFVAMAWPLLPQAWRNRVSPNTVTAVMTIGLPIAENMLSGRQQAPLRTMASVDLKRYAGTWHEIARLPAPFEAACDGQPSATYTLLGGGMVEVVNRCHTVLGRCTEVAGIAHAVPGSGGAKLKVSLFPTWLRWLPFAWADYWIVDIDDDYRTALVGNPSRSFMWVLARERHIDPPRLQRLVDIANEQGFAVDRLKVVQPD